MQKRAGSLVLEIRVEEAPAAGGEVPDGVEGQVPSLDLPVRHREDGRRGARALPPRQNEIRLGLKPNLQSLVLLCIPPFCAMMVRSPGKTP